MEIKYKSPIVTEKREKEYEINYGVLKKGSETRVEFNFSGTNYLTVNKSCGCTLPTVTPTEEGFTVEITYDNRKVGTINQWVKVNTTDGEIKFTLKGQII